MSRLRRVVTVGLTAIIFQQGTASAAEPALIRSRMRRQPLPSTALATAGYSKKLHVLEIEFCNGAVYRYLDVPATVYREFMSADSKARYYDWHIKGRYHSLRMCSSEDAAHH